MIWNLSVFFFFFGFTFFPLFPHWNSTDFPDVSVLVALVLPTAVDNGVAEELEMNMQNRQRVQVCSHFLRRESCPPQTAKLDKGGGVYPRLAFYTEIKGSTGLFIRHLIPSFPPTNKER